MAGDWEGQLDYREHALVRFSSGFQLNAQLTYLLRYFNNFKLRFREKIAIALPQILEKSVVPSQRFLRTKKILY